MYYVCVEGGRAPHHSHKSQREATAEALRLASLRNRTVQVYLLVDVVLPADGQKGQGADHGRR